MPVVALATTDATEAVPPGTGFCSTDPDRLALALQGLVAEPEIARQMGAAARAHALRRYGLDRSLQDWDDVLAQVADGPRYSGPVMVATTGRS